MEKPVVIQIFLWNSLQQKRKKSPIKVIYNDPNRPYELTFNKDTGLYTAGCHKDWTFERAFAHWSSPTYPDLVRGSEYVSALVKHHEKLADKSKTTLNLNPNDYPKLMISSFTNCIVLMTSHAQGIMIDPKTEVFPIGYVSTSWNMSILRDYHGTLKIKQ